MGLEKVEGVGVGGVCVLPGLWVGQGPGNFAESGLGVRVWKCIDMCKCVCVRVCVCM